MLPQKSIQVLSEDEEISDVGEGSCCKAKYEGESYPVKIISRGRC